MATAKKQKLRQKSAKVSAKSASRVVRQKHAIELRLQGHTVREIAERLGITKSQAHRDVEAALKQTGDEARELAEQTRKVALEQIERGIRALKGKVARGDPKAIMAFAKLDERRAKLLHLEKVKVEHTGADGAPLAVDDRGALIERLAGLVAGAAASGSAGASPGESPGATQAEGAQGS